MTFPFHLGDFLGSMLIFSGVFGGVGPSTKRNRDPKICFVTKGNS